MEGGKVMFVLLGIVALCSLVAIIISAITLSRPSQVPTINLSGLGGGGAPSVVMGGGGSCSGGKYTDRTYRIALGHDVRANSYIDDTGYLQGYHWELTAEVCGAAGIRCVLIWDKWTNCWQSKPGQHSSGGQGLLGDWYDGCIGWWKTVGRTMVFDFSESYLHAPKDYLYIRKGEKFDLKNMKDDQSIGFLDGWAQDEKCLARFNITLKTHQVKLYVTTTELQQKLHDGEIDAFFSSTNYILADNNTEMLQPSMQCTLGGNALMAQKDSPLLQHWNRGFNAIRTNGRYHRHCVESWKRHGHKGGIISCLE